MIKILRIIIFSIIFTIILPNVASNSILYNSFNQCNDSSALNYNSSSSDDSECVFYSIPSIDVTEDEDINIDLLSYAYPEDVYNSENFSFSVNCNNTAYVNGCSINDNFLNATIDDKNSNYDTGYLSLTVTYGDKTVYKSFRFNVDAVNDVPNIQEENNLQAVKNQLFEYRIDVEDVDDNNFIFSLINDPTSGSDFSLTAYSSFALVSYTPQDGDNFTSCGDNECFTFTIKVEDQGEGPESDQVDFNVTIDESNNDLPEINLTNENSGYDPLDLNSIAYEINEDQQNFKIEFRVDDDEEDLTQNDLSAVSSYTRNGQTFYLNHNSITGIYPNFNFICNPLPNWNGEFKVKIIADDDISYSTYEFKVNANAVNDPPYFTNIYDFTFDEGTSIDNQQIYYYDIDADPNRNEIPFDYSTLTFTINNLSDGSISSSILEGTGDATSSATLSFITNDPDWNGMEQFRVTINDGQGSDNIQETVNVTVNNINDLPTIDSINDQIIDEDQEDGLKIEINANDIDNDNLTFSLSTIDYADISFTNENGKDYLNLITDTHYYGNLNITVNVDDGSGINISTSFQVTVEEVNDPPYIKNLELNVDEDTNNFIFLTDIDGICDNDLSDGINCNCDDNLSYTFGACDIESSNLTFEISSNPSHGIYSLDNIAQNVNFSYTPNGDYNGSDSVDYSVCDEENLCSDGTIMINVINTNDPPVAIANDVLVDEDDSVDIQLTATDIDPNEELIYDILNNPASGSVIIDGSVVTYTPNPDANGIDSFEFSVSDGEASDSAIISITINPINDEPLAAFGIQGIGNEDQNIPITLLGTDIDGDILSYSISDLPSNGSLDNTNSENILYTPNAHFNGSDSFEFTVSDGISTDTEVVNITINAINDPPILAQINNIIFDEDSTENENKTINLLASDVDLQDSDSQEALSFSVVGGTFISSDLDANENKITFIAPENYYGSEEFTILVSDSQNEQDSQNVVVTINSVNDRTQVKKIIDSTQEDCDVKIIELNTISSDNSVCDNDILDGVVCDCSSDNYNYGVCDIDHQNLTYHIVKPPQNGVAVIDENTGTIQYTPNLNYISLDGETDDIYYQVCDGENCSLTDCSLEDAQNLVDCLENNIIVDSSNNCVDSNQCGIIQISVNEINDSPVLSCLDCNLLLSENNYIEGSQLYEDCTLDESESNQSCSTINGITVNNLRMNKDFDNQPCSLEHLWTDADCNESPNDFGIAVDVVSCINDNSDKGEWQFQKGNNDYIAFSSPSNDCDYQLLSENDLIRFVPNDNYYSKNEEYPMIKFYAWDKSMYGDQDCVDASNIQSLFNNRLNECSDGSTFSSSFMTFSLPIESVNDTPVFSPFEHDNLDENNIVILNEYCSDNDNGCSSDGYEELIIHIEDTKDPEDEFYYYISHITTSSNKNKSIFSNLNHFIDDNTGDDDLIDLNGDFYDILSPNYLELDDLVLIDGENGAKIIKLNYDENVNGSVTINIKVSDRENVQDIDANYVEKSINLDIKQVNNRISDFSVVSNISSYSNDDFIDTDFSSNSIDNGRMIYPTNPTTEQHLYIKYPPYGYNANDLDITLINDSNYKDIYDYMLLNPHQMEYMYFKWNRRNQDGNLLDPDIDVELNGEPYKLYYRLELIDEESDTDNIFVIKDYIDDSMFSGDYAYTRAKILDKEYMYYTEGSNIYNPTDTLNENNKKKFDTSGLTLYNWRIVASNYEELDVMNNYDIDTKESSISEKTYGIKINLPEVDYNFILNDIYNNYFNLYLTSKPTSYYGIANNYENISFNSNNEIYIIYNSELQESETFNLRNISLLDNTSNVFSTLGAFNDFGSIKWYIPMQDAVGNVNVDYIYINYDSVSPNTPNSFNSESGKFNLTINSMNPYNILFYELNKNDIQLMMNEDEVLSDIFVFNGNIEFPLGSISLEYDISNILSDYYIDYNKITFAKYSNGLIEKNNTYLYNNRLITDVNDFGSYILILDDSNASTSIPVSTSILSCYPNPFNPKTTINYNLEYDSKVEVEIYNLMGQKIYNFKPSLKKKGINQFTWSGYDGNGNELSSGVYIIKIITFDQILTQKVTLLK